MNQIIKENKKNYQIQFLRAVFCFAILFYHFTFRYCELFETNNIFYNPFVKQLSQVGLISFFILSGFYLIRRKPLFSNKDKLVYWVKRFLNIYLPYVSAVIVIFLLSLSGLLGTGRTVSLFGFFQNFFFINVITGQNVDGAHWYIFALLCLYIMAFIYDIIPKKENKNHPFFWIVFLSFSIISLLIQKLANNDLLIVKPFKIINFLMCRNYFPFVFIGVAFYLFDYDTLKCKNNLLLLFFSFLAIAYVAFNSWVDFIILIIASILILACLFQILTFLERIKPIIFFGNASFSIYLIHQNIGYMCLNLFTKTLNYYVSLVFTFLIVFLIGFLFYLFVEKSIKKLVSIIR